MSLTINAYIKETPHCRVIIVGGNGETFYGYTLSNTYAVKTSSEEDIMLQLLPILIELHDKNESHRVMYLRDIELMSQRIARLCEDIEIYNKGEYNKPGSLYPLTILVDALLFKNKYEVRIHYENEGM